MILTCSLFLTGITTEIFFFFLLKCVYISGGIVKIVFWNSVVRQKEILLTTDVADISRFSWSYQHTAGLEEQEIQHYFVCAISNRKKRDRHEIVRITKILLTLLSADAFSEETQQQMQKAGRNARNSQATSPVAHCHTYAHHLLLSAACGSSDNTYWVNACRVLRKLLSFLWSMIFLQNMLVSGAPADQMSNHQQWHHSEN